MWYPWVSEELQIAVIDPLDCSHGGGGGQLGWFVVSDEYKQIWVEEKVEHLLAGVHQLAGLSIEFP